MVLLVLNFNTTNKLSLIYTQEYQPLFGLRGEEGGQCLVLNFEKEGSEEK